MPAGVNPATQLLKRDGPLSSNELADGLQKGGGASTLANARKMMQRAVQRKQILSTFPVRFDKAYLYYLPEHRGKAYAGAIRKLLTLKPSMHRVYKTLLANKGWISSGQIGKASGCLPSGDVSGAGGRSTLPRVIEDLKHLELINDVIGAPNIYRIGTQFGSPEIGRGLFEHKLRIELQLLHDARDWIRNCYLLAYDSHKCRSSETSAEGFNQALWDLHGPMYAGPFVRDSTLRRTKAKEAFLVVDIVGYRTFSAVDAESLLERFKSVAYRWKTIAIVPIVIAPVFSAPAWDSLRAAGAIPVLFRDVFGKNVDALMKKLWKALTLTDNTEEQINEIKETLTIASGTLIDDSIVGHLKGALFELIIALAWRSRGYDVTLQKMVRNNEDGEEYEIDVVAIKTTDCKLIECKGRHANYREPVEEVERHFTKRCKAAADPFGWDVTGLYSTVESLFITAGDLDESAAAFASKTAKCHGISCQVWTREKLLPWLQVDGNAELKGIVERFYSSPDGSASRKDG